MLSNLFIASLALRLSCWLAPVWHSDRDLALPTAQTHCLSLCPPGWTLLSALAGTESLSLSVALLYPHSQEEKAFGEVKNLAPNIQPAHTGQGQHGEPESTSLKPGDVFLQ